MAQAFIHIEFGGGGTAGGYLSIDGGKAIKLKNDMIFALNPGSHNFAFSNKSKASRLASTATALNGDIIGTYALEHDAIDGDVTLALDENDMAFFTIVSNNFGKVIALPTYTIGELNEEQAAEAAAIAKLQKDKKSRKTKRTVGIIMILCSIISTNNALGEPAAERDAASIALCIAIGVIGVLVLLWGIGIFNKKK